MDIACAPAFARVAAGRYAPRTVRQDDPASRRGLAAALAALVFAVALAARLHNAWAAPVLAGYDAFGHFVHVWFVAETGRFPMPTHGWSFFHPPLYYALMAAVWNALDAFDPALRLKAGRLLIAALGAVHPLVAWFVVRRRFPAEPRLAFLASAMMLLIPVELYSAGFLGNEGIHAVTGTLALAALLAALGRPGFARAALLGVALGAALLAKYSAVALAAGALGAMAGKAVATRDLLRGGLRTLVAAAAMLAVCGPYYARNIAAYGQPFQLSRDTFAVSYVESNQPQAARGWADYLTFDPLIFRRPVWPRGATPSEDASPHGFGRAVRESVWTGLYANAWFDGFGGWVLPPVTGSERARRAGQALLTLGLGPTLLMLFGAGTAVAGLRRRGWREDDDATVSFALVSVAMGALFVYGTHAAPIAAAVKATYFTPVSVVFAYWFAVGAERFERGSPWRRRAVNAVCATLGALSLAVFWQGLLFDVEPPSPPLPHFADAKATQFGIVEYAGGNVDAARRAFEQASVSDYHLAWENLGFLAVDDGRLREGLRLLRRAAAKQEQQPDGGPVGRERHLALARAESLHSIAVVLHAMGRVRKAEALWTKALVADPLHAEALWCLGQARVEDAYRETRNADERRAALQEAAATLANVRRLDPGLKEGWSLGATVEALRGDCDAAQRLADEWKALPCWVERNFPAETGTGAGFSASIGRRRLAVSRVPQLDAGQLALTCGVVFD